MDSVERGGSPDGNRRSRRVETSFGHDWDLFVNGWDALQGVSNGSVTSFKCINKGEDWLIVVTATDGKNELVWFRGVNGVEDVPSALARCISSDRWKESKPFRG